jgi:hypothetical protein
MSVRPNVSSNLAAFDPVARQRLDQVRVYHGNVRQETYERGFEWRYRRREGTLAQRQRGRKRRNHVPDVNDPHRVRHFIQHLATEGRMNLRNDQIEYWVARQVQALYLDAFRHRPDLDPLLRANWFNFTVQRNEGNNNRLVATRFQNTHESAHRNFTLQDVRNFTPAFYRAILSTIQDLRRDLASNLESGNIFEDAIGQEFTIEIFIYFGRVDPNYPLPELLREAPINDNAIHEQRYQEEYVDLFGDVVEPVILPQRRERRVRIIPAENQEVPVLVRNIPRGVTRSGRRFNRQNEQHQAREQAINRRRQPRALFGLEPVANVNQISRTRSGRPYASNIRGRTMFAQLNSEIDNVKNSLGIRMNDDYDSGLCLTMSVMMAEIIEYQYNQHNVPLSHKKGLYALYSHPFWEQYQINKNCATVDWTIQAREFFIDTLVKLQIYEPLDNLELSLPVYAEAYGINIHVFKVKHNERFAVYSPPTISFKHMVLLLDGTHMHPIVNIKQFMNQNGNLICLHCCAGVTCKEITWKNHVKKCHFGPSRFASKQIRAKQRELVCEEYRKVFPRNGKMVCKLCNKEDVLENHICFITAPKIKEPIPEDKLWVIDIECCQDEVVTATGVKYKHRPVLVCMANMYDETLKHQFEDVGGFIDLLIANPVIWNHTTFLAHNGGGYDYQQFIQECESRGVKYTSTPTPGSKHKFLEVEIHIGEKEKVRCIDFMRFVGGSLARIADSFGLQDSKSYFPHRFLTSQTLQYIGPLPMSQPLSEDYWCTKNLGSEEDVHSFDTWYQALQAQFCICENGRLNCQCGRPMWNLQEYMTKYCWIDVKVLSQACRTFRDQCMNPAGDGIEEFGWSAKSVDPFTCLTQSQLAMTIFMNGFRENPGIYLPDERWKVTDTWHKYWWLKCIQEETNGFIRHMGNSLQEEYNAERDIFFDGYCRELNTGYVYINCDWYGCPNCHPDRESINEQRQLSYEQCEQDFKKKYEHPPASFPRYLVSKRTCEIIVDQAQIEEAQHWGNIIHGRTLFYGGRTEVFDPFVDSEKLRLSGDPNYEIEHYDVCSLYPTVCSHDLLPTGVPELFYGGSIDVTRLASYHNDRYFGFVKAKVTPNPEDTIGLLPRRIGISGDDAGGKLVFDLQPKVGEWATCELYLAMEHGYRIDEVYQVIHFPPDQRSKVMKGYMSHFLRTKQENEGWKKLGATCDSPSEEEKEQVAEAMFQDNGCMGRVRLDKVTKNPVQRHVSKIFLNCLWGKFGQRKNDDFFCDIANYEDFEALMFHSNVDPATCKIRQTISGTYKVHGTKRPGAVAPNKRGNIYMAATVTAEARCRLHSQILIMEQLKIAYKIYCDTDSWFLRVNPLLMQLWGEYLNMNQPGLGKWVKEHKGQRILTFVAAAPKMYSMIFDDGEQETKAKGVRLTLGNQAVLTIDEFKRALFYFKREQEYNKLQLYNMTIFPNSNDTNFPYAQMMTRYNEKAFSAVITKRTIDNQWGDFDITTVQDDDLPRVFENIACIHSKPL